MPKDNTTWGVVSTVRAPARDILRFAAYHLDLGAHRLFIYLDEKNPQAYAPLKAHSKIRVTTCDRATWKRRNGWRPVKHQRRQTVNATHAYNRADVDWLAHIDVDEFFWPHEPMADLLEVVPAPIPAVRIRPMEALSCGEDLYKTFIPASSERTRTVCELYPLHGAFVRGGFMSHVAGKLFVRTGLPDIEYRIHNYLQNGRMKPCHEELEQVDLCHRHGQNWQDWHAHYRYRLEKGSYRAELAPNVPRNRGGLSMHELLSNIEENQGEAGLRAFFDELSAADARVRAQLASRGMIKHRPLDLDEKVSKHFPGAV